MIFLFCHIKHSPWSFGNIVCDTQAHKRHFLEKRSGNDRQSERRRQKEKERGGEGDKVTHTHSKRGREGEREGRGGEGGRGEEVLREETHHLCSGGSNISWSQSDSTPGGVSTFCFPLFVSVVVARRCGFTRLFSDSSSFLALVSLAKTIPQQLVWLPVVRHLAGDGVWTHWLAQLSNTS